MSPAEMSLSELEAHVAELKNALEAKRKTRTAEVIASIKAMAAEVGLTVTIEGAPEPTGSPTKGVKVPPKYRDPASGKTWSGRGVRPKWLNGSDLEQFRI